MIHLILTLYGPNERPDEYRDIDIFTKSGLLDSTMNPDQHAGIDWNDVIGWIYTSDRWKQTANPRAPGDVFEARCSECAETACYCASPDLNASNCGGALEIVPREDLS